MTDLYHCDADTQGCAAARPDTVAATCPGMRPLFQLSAGYELLLASGSPRRRQFMNEWGLPFRLALASADEPRPIPGESPEAYTRRAASAKGLAVAQDVTRFQAPVDAASGTSIAAQPVILAADTVVAIGGEILGKPENPAHALSMLERLNGTCHEVISAVCLLLPAKCAGALAASSLPGAQMQDTPDGAFRMLSFSDVSRVCLYRWPLSVLQAYVKTGEPTDKAGSYAIQGQGAFLVERVEGSWSTVVGLPVTPLAKIMLNLGIMQPYGA